MPQWLELTILMGALVAIQTWLLPHMGVLT